MMEDTARTHSGKMTPQKSKERVKRGTTFTVNLHEDVLQNIISFLPIKDATRCGQLSTRFKNSWRFCRNLVFDLDFARDLTRENQIRVINRVFNQHLGPQIDIFHLYFDPTDVEALVEHWLKKVTLKGVEELDLNFTRAGMLFKLPSHLFEVESIRSLKLTCCGLDLPTKLQGLSFLKTLVLRRVIINTIQIATIFANCLLLEGIELLRCYGTLHLDTIGQHLKKYKQLVVGDCDIISIDIDDPNLSILSLCGGVCHFRFYSPLLNLDEAVLNFTSTRLGFSQLCLVNNLVISISNVNILKVDSAFVKGLSPKFTDGTFVEGNYFLGNLKEFHLISEGRSSINPYDIVSLLKNCLNVERVFLDLGEFPFENGLYWKLHGKPELEKCNPTFPRLKKIVVNGFKFRTVELVMLKFFLNQAKFLESVALVPSSNCHSKGFSQDEYQKADQLFCSWKASPNTTIRIFKNIRKFKNWTF